MMHVQNVCVYKFRKAYLSYSCTSIVKEENKLTMYAGIWIVIISLPSDCFEVKDNVYFHDIDRVCNMPWDTSQLWWEISYLNSPYFSMKICEFGLCHGCMFERTKCPFLREFHMCIVHVPHSQFLIGSDKKITSEKLNKNLCLRTILSEHVSELRSINPFDRFRTNVFILLYQLASRKLLYLIQIYMWTCQNG